MRLPILLFIYVMLSLTSACADKDESPTGIGEIEEVIVWVQCDLEKTIDPYVSSRDGFTEDQGDLILIKTTRTFFTDFGDLDDVISSLDGYWVSKNYLSSTSLLPEDKFRFRYDELHMSGSIDSKDSNEYMFSFNYLLSNYDFTDTLNLDDQGSFFYLNRDDLSLDRGWFEREQLSTCEVIEESVALTLFHEYGSKLDLLFQQRDDERGILKIESERNHRI